MKPGQIVAQLFTIRDFIKTPKDIAQSMKKIKAIGFEAVQVSAMGPIPEEELMKILDGEGLACIVTHEPAQKIIDEPEAVVERLSKLNCKYTAYPHPANVSFDSLAEFRKNAKTLNPSQKRAAYALHGSRRMRDSWLQGRSA